MTQRGLLITIGAAATLITSATAFAQQGAGAAPTALIESIYRLYIKTDKNSTKTPDQYTRAWYSAKIRAKIAEIEKACKKREDICWPDSDFLVDGQDFEIRDLKVREVARTDRDATVEAKFRNFAEPHAMTFTLVRENGRWVIDEMVGRSKDNPEGYKLSEFLKAEPPSR